MTQIHYRVRPARPAAHLFEVQVFIPEPASGGQVFSMPAWIPGSYMIRDFAKNVVWIRPECEGREVALRKLDKQTWQADACDGPLALRYAVYAWDLSVRGAHLDTTHGYFNGTSLFVRVHGFDEQPCIVDLLRADDGPCQDWQVATTLPRDGAPEWGFGRYCAADYDELIDHPVEMGQFSRVDFEACGVPHQMVITGRHNADNNRLAADLRRICEYQIRLFGEPAPMDRYLFQVMAVGDGYGGLEHRASTSLLCSRNDLPRHGQTEIGESYRTFLGLCSHEYFHTWNVKRIKPAAFLPYDLSQEVHTPLLWAFEGFTAYYDDLTLARSGLIDEKGYLELLGQTITRVLRSGGRRHQSLSESSFDTWTKLYKADENAPNAIVSYYVKGALVALALDLLLRKESDGKRSLDDLMRALWERHGKPGIGVTEQGIEALASKIAQRDLTDFFDQAVRGTDDLPLADLLAPLGVNYRVRAAESASDKGGRPASSNAPPRPYLGLRTSDDPLGARITTVLDYSPAQEAGLSAGDVIVALESLRATHGTWEKQLDDRHPADRLTVHAFRRDELMSFNVRLGNAPEDTCYLELREDVDDATRALRQGWLQG